MRIQCEMAGQEPDADAAHKLREYTKQIDISTTF
jgi:hypothetical protein